MDEPNIVTMDGACIGFGETSSKRGLFWLAISGKSSRCEYLNRLAATALRDALTRCLEEGE